MQSKSSFSGGGRFFVHALVLSSEPRSSPKSVKQRREILHCNPQGHASDVMLAAQHTRGGKHVSTPRNFLVHQPGVVEGRSSGCDSSAVRSAAGAIHAGRPLKCSPWCRAVRPGVLVASAATRAFRRPRAHTLQREPSCAPPSSLVYPDTLNETAGRGDVVGNIVASSLSCKVAARFLPQARVEP
mmetsp:Transcript_112901/g.324496  ORF Transcript_112901/g.324496 Transcript_112901/m.324496 type:complete len:185 (-) Transcript_112901:89-643(-)|eukprot:CAMPEP_0170427274 /NCGR_PEP_ID=MMETSP0117_2-20130122/39130_1 /TAXON_ID=400756 /ORGANISM="Durinskia baltica, Strain CSIRO CS-38" /LENGTH=184 /DNA_ID=CAMNT_0010686451 /DNA_START=125 /DNA_END=679 /DNA_ORIENTATION=-